MKGLYKAIIRAKHKTYSPLDYQWVILPSSKAFSNIQTRRDERNLRAFHPPLFVSQSTVEDRMRYPFDTYS